MGAAPPAKEAIVFDTVLGIPLHPLVVHGVVVLAPLTALLLVLFALTEGLRSRIGVVLPLLASATSAGAFVAARSGEALRERIGGGGDLVATHVSYAERLPLATLVVAVLAWLEWAAWRRGRRAGEPGSGPGGLFRALSLVGVLAALAITVLVVLAGHSGSESVWSGVGG